LTNSTFEAGSGLKPVAHPQNDAHSPPRQAGDHPFQPAAEHECETPGESCVDMAFITVHDNAVPYRRTNSAVAEQIRQVKDAAVGKASDGLLFRGKNGIIQSVGAIQRARMVRGVPPSGPPGRLAA
jgi:hypothetical protein